MKKLALAITVGMLSSISYAGETNSMRTPQGDLVRVGDTKQSVIDKMGRVEPKFYVLDDGKRHCAATEYTYDIDLQRYKVISCRDRVVKILWENR